MRYVIFANIKKTIHFFLATNLAEGPDVPVEEIFAKFPITRNEFEEFFVAGKFVRVATKISMICTKCGNKVPIANKTGTLCAMCAKKLQNEI